MSGEIRSLQNMRYGGVHVAWTIILKYEKGIQVRRVFNNFQIFIHIT